VKLSLSWYVLMLEWIFFASFLVVRMEVSFCCSFQIFTMVVHEDGYSLLPINCVSALVIHNCLSKKNYGWMMQKSVGLDDMKASWRGLVLVSTSSGRWCRICLSVSCYHSITTSDWFIPVLVWLSIFCVNDSWFESQMHTRQEVTQGSRGLKQIKKRGYVESSNLSLRYNSSL
jgi:hypothetical protein